MIKDLTRCFHELPANAVDGFRQQPGGPDFYPVLLS